MILATPSGRNNRHTKRGKITSMVYQHNSSVSRHICWLTASHRAAMRSSCRPAAGSSPLSQSKLSCVLPLLQLKGSYSSRRVTTESCVCVCVCVWCTRFIDETNKSTFFSQGCQVRVSKFQVGFGFTGALQATGAAAMCQIERLAFQTARIRLHVFRYPQHQQIKVAGCGRYFWRYF